METKGRSDANFLKVEAMLFEKLTKAGVSSMSSTALLKLPRAILEGTLGWLGFKKIWTTQARADRNEVWILDNTAYKSSETSPWTADVVACFFQQGRGDLTAAAAAIADAIGLDGKSGSQEQTKAIIEERLKPFIDAVAPAVTLPVVQQQRDGKSVKKVLGPSDSSGVSSQHLEVGTQSQQSGETNTTTSDSSVRNLPQAQGVTRLAGPQGWGVISDIDDTIKITQVSSVVLTRMLD